MDVLHEKAVTYARSIVTADHEGSLTFSLTDFFSQVFPAREAEHMQQRDDKSRRSDPKNHAGHCQGFHFPFLGFPSIHMNHYSSGSKANIPYTDRETRSKLRLVAKGFLYSPGKR